MDGKWTPPSDAIRVAKKSSWQPPSDAIVKKKDGTTGSPHNFLAGDKPTPQDLQYRKELADAANGSGQLNNGSKTSQNTKKEVFNTFNQKALENWGKKHTPTDIPLDHIPAKQNKQSNTQSWLNLPKLAVNNTFSGLDKDAANVFGFLKDKLSNPFLFGSASQQFGGLEDVYRKQQLVDEQRANQHQLPNNTAGNIATDITKMGSDLVELATTPEFEIANFTKLGKYSKIVNKGVNYLVGKFPIQQASKEMMQKYADARKDNKSESDANLEALKGFGQGYKNGLVFEVAGNGASKLTEFGVKALDKAGLMAANNFIAGGEKRLLNSMSQGLAFSTAPVIQNALEGKPTDWEEIKKNGLFGVVLGALHGGETNKEVNEKPTTSDQASAQILMRKPIIDLHNFINTDVKDIIDTHNSDHTSADFLAKSTVNADKGFNSEDEQEKAKFATQSSLFGKAASVKSITEAIMNDKEGLVDEVNQMDIPDDAKKQAIDKINEVHKEIDPVKNAEKNVLLKQKLELQKELEQKIIDNQKPKKNENETQTNPVADNGQSKTESSEENVGGSTTATDSNTGEESIKGRNDEENLATKGQKVADGGEEPPLAKPRYTIKGEQVTPKENDTQNNTDQEAEERNKKVNEENSKEAHLIISANVKSALADGRKKQVVVLDENEKPTVEEHEFNQEDAENELDYLEALAKKGKLTKEKFQSSYFGQATDSTTLQAAFLNIKNDPEGFIGKLRKAFEGDTQPKEPEPKAEPEKPKASEIEDPDLIEANNAYMDAKVAGKFGTDVLDNIIKKLKDTNLENIVNKVKDKIAKKATYLEDVRKRILSKQSGTEEDQAALLMDQYHLKGQEDNLIKAINFSENPEEIKQHQKELEKIQNDILDNALANRMIGRQASSIFRLRQVAIDQDANLQNMREKYMATEGVKELTKEQEDYIKKQYNTIKEAELKVKKLREEEKQIRAENERLQNENDALKKIIDTAKAKHANTRQNSTDALKKIRKNIDVSKAELGKIFSSNAFLSPEVYKHLKNIALGKAEELYVKTKTAIQLDKLVKSVMDEIKDVAQNITERDVRDAISGNHTTTKKITKTELQKNLQEIKRTAKILSDYQDMMDGKLTKKIPTTDKAELERLQAERKADTETETKAWNIKKYKQLKAQEKAIQERIDNKDYTTPKKEAVKYEKSKQLIDAERDLAIKKFRWDKDRKQALMKNRPWYQKVIDNILAWQKFAVLSYPSTFVKLASTAFQGVALKPFQLGVQQLMHYITPKDMQGIIGGKVRKEAIADFYSKWLQNFHPKIFVQHMKGIDEAEVMYGSPRYEYDGISLGEKYNNFIQTPGRIHGYIKSFLKAPETAFARKQLVLGYSDKMEELQSKLKDPNLTDAEKNKLQNEYNQYDLTNDDNLDRIEQLATAQGRWAILMNDNHVVQSFRGFMSRLGILGDIGKTEYPILKIPMNYGNRYFLDKLGLLQAIIGKKNFITGELEHPGLITHFLKGTENMTDKQKELFSRSAVYGSMGAAAFTAGFLLHKQIKKNEDGSFSIDGKKLNKEYTHNPLIDNIFSGAETAQRIGKKDNWIEAYVKSDIDVMKKMPYVEQLKYGFTAKIAQAIYEKKEKTMSKKLNQAFDDKISDMIVPGFLKQWALAQDTRSAYKHRSHKITTGAIIKEIISGGASEEDYSIKHKK